MHWRIGSAMERLSIAIFVFSVIASTTLGQKSEFDCETGEAAAKEAAKVVGDLAIKLYHQVGKPEENIFFSPASIAVVLAALKRGAAGTTRDEIAALIDSKGAKDSVRLYQSLQHHLQLKHDTADLNIIKGLFISNLLLPFKVDFTAISNGCLQVAAIPTTFKSNPERGRSDINRWASEQTAKHVPELFTKGSIDKNTLIALGTSAYLTASWPEEMKVERSSFYRLGKNDQAQMVNFMTHQGDFGHYSGDNFDVLELPFSDIPLSLFVILPKTRDGLAAVEKSLTGDQVIGFADKVKRRLVSLKVPNIVLRQSIDLAAVLAKLGVKQAFSDQADFSRISDKAKAKISKAMHEVYLHLNEDGANSMMESETAQGSNVVVPKTPEPPMPFVADHPFAYAVVHKPTGAIVYMGRVNFVAKQEQE